MRIKIIAAVLVCFALSVAPTLASAAEPFPESTRLVKKWANDNGYNYVKLSSMASVSSQIKRSRTVYEIASKFNLNGRTVVFPDDVYLHFSKGGSLVNGSFKGTLMNEVLDVDNFGATGDGHTDDRAAIQSVIDIAAHTVRLAPKTYYLGASLIITKDGVNICGSEGTAIHIAASENKYVNAISIVNKSNVSISGIKFYSDNIYRGLTSFDRKQMSNWSNVICIQASGVDGFTVAACEFENLEYALKVDGGYARNKNVVVDHVTVGHGVALPVYVSYTNGMVFQNCVIEASTEGSLHDHHIYGCNSVYDHIIQNCTFKGGVGVPVHYYSLEKDAAHNIVVKDCFFEETCGVAIISSSDKGDMYVSGIKMRSQREYGQAVFRNEGQNKLIVKDCVVDAQHQYLIAASGASTFLSGVMAEVGGLFISMPQKGSDFTMSGCDVTVSNAKDLFYTDGPGGRSMGKVTIKSNTITTLCKMEYLFSIRGTTTSDFVVDNNTITCNAPVDYVFYHGGVSNPKIKFLNNNVTGCASAKHRSVVDGTFKNNSIQN